MKINSLYISKYKNLNNIRFSLGDNDFAIFIGNNGSGKSNFLEAVVLLFKEIYLQENPSFDFEIDYNLHDGRNIYVKGICNKDYQIKINGEEISKNQLKVLIKDQVDSILPHNILVYYSGHSNRLAKFMEFSTTSYIQEIKRGLYKPRHFFYLHPSYFPLLLLSILGSEMEDIRLRLKETLHIDELSSFHIKIDKKSGTSIKYLSAFFNVLREYSSNIEESQKEILFFFEGVSLKEIIKSRVIGYDRDFFKFLDIAFCTGVLLEVQVNCLLESGNTINDTEFSEGEQQLITVNSMIEFFGYKDTLYLFDEPDTFFHPKWQREFLNYLRKTGVQTQFLVTTHSPLMLSNITEENIYLMKDGQVFSPDSNGSKGRDVNGILSEIMEVSERPPVVQELINKFHEQVARQNINGAKQYLELLRDKISLNDPFLLEADSILDILSEVMD